MYSKTVLILYIKYGKKKVHSESKHAGPEKVNYQMLYIFSSLISRYGELHCFFSVELALYSFDNPQS